MLLSQMSFQLKCIMKIIVRATMSGLLQTYMPCFTSVRYQSLLVLRNLRMFCVERALGLDILVPIAEVGMRKSFDARACKKEILIPHCVRTLITISR